MPERQHAANQCQHPGALRYEHGNPDTNPRRTHPASETETAITSSEILQVTYHIQRLFFLQSGFIIIIIIIIEGILTQEEGIGGRLEKKA
jgi:hypothetical protein